MGAGRVTTASPGAPSARPRRCSSSWVTARRCRSRSPGSALALLALLAACKQAPPAEPPTLVARVDAAIARGAGFLQEAQGADGAVRSRTYAFFKDGWSLTPLAMMGLYAHPDGAPGARAKGVAFLRGLVTPGGALHGPPDGPRYPLYALALSILVLNTERD